MEARGPLAFTAYDPLTGEAVATATLAKGERTTLPAGPGVLILVGDLAKAAEPGEGH